MSERRSVRRGRVSQLAAFACVLGGVLLMAAGPFLWLLHGMYPADLVIDRTATILLCVGQLTIAAGALFIDEGRDGQDQIATQEREIGLMGDQK